MPLAKHVAGSFFARFLGLVLLLSLPFWLLEWLAKGYPDQLQVNLPLSALMFVCPALAALILSHRADLRRGARNLLLRVFDGGRIRPRVWCLPALLLMPTITVLAYTVMRLLERPLPNFEVFLLPVVAFCLVFFVSVVGEELGWTGYALEPLQARYGALVAGLLLGLVWALWHIVPYIQAGNSGTWIVWQCVYTVAARVLLVWLYGHAGHSLLAVILAHASINVSVFLFPVYGSHYDPFFAATLACAVAVVLWPFRSRSIL